MKVSGEIKLGYKKTKLGWIPEEWDEFVGRELFKNRKTKGTNELIVYSVTINSGLIPRDQNERKTNTLEGTKSLLIEKNDLTYNMMRMWQGAVGIAKGKGVVSPAYVVIRPNITLVNSIFSFYLLKTKRYLHILKSFSYGLTEDRLRLYFKDFALIPFFLPPLREQENIVHVITTWIKAIKNLEELIVLKEAQKKGLMQKLLSGKIRVNNYSKKWKTIKLGDLGEFKTSSVNKKIHKDEKLIHLVNYNNVYRHEVITNKNKHLLMKVSANETQLEGNNLKKGDMLFTPSSETPMDIGHSVVIIENLENTLYSYHLIRFRPKVDLDIHFSHYFCNSSSVLKQLSRYATGSTRFTISISSFSKVEVQLPEIEEQRKIADILFKKDKEIKLLNERLRKTIKQKNELIRQLMNGKLRAVNI